MLFQFLTNYASDLLIQYLFDFLISVLGSDVVYSEDAVVDLLETLGQLSGPTTTIFLAGELRNGKGIALFSSILDFSPYHSSE